MPFGSLLVDPFALDIMGAYSKERNAKTDKNQKACNQRNVTVAVDQGFKDIGTVSERYSIRDGSQENGKGLHGHKKATEEDHGKAEKI